MSCRARRGAQGNPPPRLSSGLTARFPNQPALIALTMPALQSAIAPTSQGTLQPLSRSAYPCQPRLPPSVSPHLPFRGSLCLGAAAARSGVSQRPAPARRCQRCERGPPTPAPRCWAPSCCPMALAGRVGDASRSCWGQDRVSALLLTRRSPSISGSSAVPQSPLFTAIPRAILSFRGWGWPVVPQPACGTCPVLHWQHPGW